jgi:hypothetical protein
MLCPPFPATAVQKGLSRPTLQHLLGRDRPSTSEGYLDLSPEEERAFNGKPLMAQVVGRMWDRWLRRSTMRRPRIRGYRNELYHPIVSHAILGFNALKK